MAFIKSALLASAVLLATNTVASAAVVSFSTTFGPLRTDFTTGSLILQSFDSSLGTLTGVQFSLMGSGNFAGHRHEPWQFSRDVHLKREHHAIDQQRHRGPEWAGHKLFERPDLHQPSSGCLGQLRSVLARQHCYGEPDQPGGLPVRTVELHGRNSDRDKHHRGWWKCHDLVRHVRKRRRCRCLYLQCTVDRCAGACVDGVAGRWHGRPWPGPSPQSLIQVGPKNVQRASPGWQMR